jgi:hypothetical protein
LFVAESVESENLLTFANQVLIGSGGGGRRQQSKNQNSSVLMTSIRSWVAEICDGAR